MAMGIALLVIGRVQQKIIYQTIEKSLDQSLRKEAVNIQRQIDYRNGWSLQGYRQEPNDFEMATFYYVVDNNGHIADIQGQPPEFQKARLPKMGVIGFPFTVHTPFNENWRLLVRKIDDGWIVIGKWNFHGTDDDGELKNEILSFGSHLSDAKQAPSRHLNVDTDFALFDSNWNYIGGNGGIPFIIPENQIDQPRPGSYQISVPVLSENGKPTNARIVLAKDLSNDISTIKTIDKTNKTFALYIAISAITLGSVFLFPMVFLRKRNITIEEALRSGEGKHIEFKSTFQCRVRDESKLHEPAEKDNEKRLAILKAIAGFLNGDGGTLFIGIMEQPPDPPFIRGLPEDLELVENNQDSLRRILISIIVDRIGKQFSDLISDRIEDYQGRLCWIISVSRSPEPAFVRWKSEADKKEIKHFYVREGPRTADLDLENTWRYIKNRWRN